MPRRVMMNCRLRLLCQRIAAWAREPANMLLRLTIEFEAAKTAGSQTRYGLRTEKINRSYHRAHDSFY